MWFNGVQRTTRQNMSHVHEKPHSGEFRWCVWVRLSENHTHTQTARIVWSWCLYSWCWLPEPEVRAAFKYNFSRFSFSPCVWNFPECPKGDDTNKTSTFFRLLNQKFAHFLSLSPSLTTLIRCNRFAAIVLILVFIYVWLSVDSVFVYERPKERVKSPTGENGANLVGLVGIVNLACCKW